MKAAVVLSLLLLAGVCSADNSFDFFIFVTEWNSTVTTQYFTIHGLWPQNNDGSYPSYCDGEPFTTQAISDLLPTMDKVWPSDQGNNTEFWSHEWSKHGTCSGYDIHSFFQTVINLHSKYDVLSALSQAGIVPTSSKTYESSAVISGIDSQLSSIPVLNCANDVLAEVGLCVSKNMTLMDCPNNMGNFWSCPSKVKFQDS